jgi:hypothetical protein
MSTIQIRDTRGNDKNWPFASTTATLKKLEEAFRSSLGSCGRLSITRDRGPRASGSPNRRRGRGTSVQNELLPGIARGHAALQARRQLKERWSHLKPTAKIRRL